jgi:DNA-binding IscR family transcriptional regulator
MLARSPVEITMAEVVEALEGSIAPIECISESPDGSIVCARESSGKLGSSAKARGPHCPTKLLWTKVRFSIVRTLQETTLADLVLGPSLPASAALSPAGALTSTLSSIDIEPKPLTTGA